MARSDNQFFAFGDHFTSSGGELEATTVKPLNPGNAITRSIFTTFAEESSMQRTQ